VLNIHAGFDDTTELLRAALDCSRVRSLDFFDPQTNTERSIERARRNSVKSASERVSLTMLPTHDKSVDTIFLIFAAHEIRDDTLRTRVFQELKRSLAPGGTIVLVEHVRDFRNALIYSIGVRHFYSVQTWLTAIEAAGLTVTNQTRITPFVRVFALTYGTAY
jgi:SAM-dependent methyltransferase